MPSWICKECDYENEGGDAVCAACEEPRPEDTAAAAADDEEDEYKNFCVGVITACEDVAGAKLKRLQVNVGAEKTIPVVTNASNVKEGDRICVACAGASVKGETVEKTNVKGFPSHGMVCDSVMLGWAGGGAGAAALLPESCAVGSRPPATRPRA